VYAVASSMGTNIEAAKMGYVTEFLKGLPKDYPLHLLKKMTEVRPLQKQADSSRKLQFKIV
jgi:hypothetical protein